MKPPSVEEVTSPHRHTPSRITPIVHSIAPPSTLSSGGVWLGQRPSATPLCSLSLEHAVPADAPGRVCTTIVTESCKKSHLHGAFHLTDGPPWSRHHCP